MTKQHAFGPLLRLLVQRESLLMRHSAGHVVTTSAFFLLMLILFPMTLPLGTNFSVLSGSLLACMLMFTLLLPAQRMFQTEYQEGILTQWCMSGVPLSLIVGLKIAVQSIYHWLPICLVAGVAVLVFNLSFHAFAIVLLGITVVLPAMLTIATLGHALTLSSPANGAVLALLVIPLFIPGLLFFVALIQSSVLELTSWSAGCLLFAFCILCITTLPFAIAGALRLQLS